MRDHIDGATPPRTVTLAFERVPSVVQLVLKRFEWTSTGSRKVRLCSASLKRRVAVHMQH